MSVVCYIDSVPNPILKEILEYEYSNTGAFGINKSLRLELVSKRWKSVIQTSEFCRYINAITKNSKSPCKLFCAFLKKIGNKEYPIGNGIIVPIKLKDFVLLKLKKNSKSLYMITPSRPASNRASRQAYAKQLIDLMRKIREYAPSIRIENSRYQNTRGMAVDLKYLLFDSTALENVLQYLYMNVWSIAMDEVVCYRKFKEFIYIDLRLWKEDKTYKREFKWKYNTTTRIILEYMFENSSYIIKKLKECRGRIDDLI